MRRSLTTRSSIPVSIVQFLLMMLTSPGIVAGANINNVDIVSDPVEWFQGRYYAISGNRLAEQSPSDIATQASKIYLPTSTDQVATILKKEEAPSNSKNDDEVMPIACVCGGHEAANVALIAAPDAIILDFAQMKNITLSSPSPSSNDGNQNELTVQAGVVFQELVEFVRAQGGAIPIGTGPSVGVVGYIVNGGLSGYFSRRLGLLGQRVTRFTMVLADGTVKEDVTRESDKDLFLSVLGAGSALGVITEISFTMERESILQSATQFVAAFNSPELGIQFSRQLLSVFRDTILPNPATSMELVYTSGSAAAVTLVFYDTFTGNVSEVVNAIKAKATDLGLMIVQESNWTTWYEVASALWPLILGTSGKPLALLQHAVGTKTTNPTDATLDYLANTWIGEAPLVGDSIVEIRTLGGEIENLPPIPSGNVFHPFFADMIVQLDAQNKSLQEMQDIGKQVTTVLSKARKVPELSVDMSGTHSQSDDKSQLMMPPPVDLAVILGSDDMANTVQTTKKQVDPQNHFQFHPFQNVLTATTPDDDDDDMNTTPSGGGVNKQQPSRSALLTVVATMIGAIGFVQ